MTDERALILDGAAGTYLESIGVSLHPKLWSSGELMTPEGQENIKKLHQAYIRSNADVITSVTYQASIQGFMAAGISQGESYQLITKGVTLAREAADAINRTNNRNVRVAAGLGPYGAYLSNGEEYTGDYGLKLTPEEFDAFWIPRVKACLEGDPDFLLFETIPNYNELECILKKAVPLARAKNVPIWISLSLKVSNEATGAAITLADGTSIAQIRDLISQNSGAIELIGANCFDIANVPCVISELSNVGLPLIIYPNSGEIYDGHTKTWKATAPSGRDWHPKTWCSQGVSVIGGCCRTTPQIIENIYSAFHET